jgi:hypothetical protein
MTSLYTPFSCKKPSNDEQPGPPFVLGRDQFWPQTPHAVIGGYLPEDEIIFVAFRSWGVIPKKELGVL